ncbi:segregation and condensation protein B [Sporosarcina sp. NCCP-2222]|uniref:SMC-Scp complex subunit ScpB n=1 Tax=Sporosarcina sp. NCCP-2222 TaxID=2935073 RepID=UPI00208B5BBC|nr:SMC-Scp complex subunit ScpB [Sporosarcina sp. NCCP-2222]GKV55471.1 segregation and condensation protein B [Sporosarcina sp. NCCP-2222]
MNEDEVMHGRIESLLFVAGDDGLAPEQIAAIIDSTKANAETLLDQLQERYENRQDAGITLRKYGGRYRLVTKGEFAGDITKMLENPSPKSMTQASMEVLAIIAYKQPVTRVEIDDLRGVKSEGPLQTLVAKGFIMEKGRLEGSGRPILYGTTELFLDRFGLESIDGLPPLTEVEEGEQEDTDLFMTKFQEAFNMQEDEGGIID